MTPRAEGVYQAMPIIRGGMGEGRAEKNPAYRLVPHAHCLRGGERLCVA